MTMTTSRGRHVAADPLLTAPQALDRHRPRAPDHGPHAQPTPPPFRFEWACPHPCRGLQAGSARPFAPLDASPAFVRHRLMAAARPRLLALLDALR